MTSRVAILFVDIAGSTALYERLGNTAAKRLVTGCLGILGEEVDRQDGQVVQAIGDELMCRFPSAEDACLAAIRMQQRLAQQRLDPEVPVRVRVGFEWGEALSEGNNLYGDAVNTAARLAHMAKGGQIMTSEGAVRQAGASVDTRCRPLGTLPLKGKEEPLTVCEILWRPEDLAEDPIGSTILTRAAPRRQHLHLVFGDLELRMGGDRPRITLGRDMDNDLVIPYPEASRFHATIEARLDKFYLDDHSANGTTLIGPDGTQIVLHREEAPLSGRGQILCGGVASQAEPVRYATHEPDTLPAR